MVLGGQDGRIALELLCLQQPLPSDETILTKAYDKGRHWRFPPRLKANEAGHAFVSKIRIFLQPEAKGAGHRVYVA
jgi:hypothetical protein